MKKLRLFLDSNLFLSYAIDFESTHAKSELLFHGNYERFTGIRVRMELNKIQKRRSKLYEDLGNFYNQNENTQTYTPTVALKKNDETHLHNLLDYLKSLNGTKVMTLLRKIERIIRLGIQNALSKIKSPLISPSPDLVCTRLIGECIPNKNDAEIFGDALYWAETTNHATFCSNDYSDIINRRPRIYNKVCQIRLYDPSDNPLKIISLDELIP